MRILDSRRGKRLAQAGNGSIDATRRHLLKAGAAAAAMTYLPAAWARRAGRSWSVFETARDSTHRLAWLASPTAAANAAKATLTCDPQPYGAPLLGFGGALTESAAYVLAQLPKAARARVLHRYYDLDDGIGYTLARTPMTSCDFSRTSWTLDDVDGDRELKHFSLAPMRQWQLPLIRDVRDLVGAKRFKLVASPWSPPAWMKTNRSMIHGGALRADCRGAWADYFVRFVKAMHDEERIAVWALTVQNEPDAAQPWESCEFSPWAELDFVANSLGPALERARLSQVKLFGWDHNRDGLPERASAMLGDPRSAKYLAGLAVHWYGREAFAATSSVLSQFPEKQILLTEACVEGGAHAGEWAPAERYARNIIGDLRSGVCGFIDWNIALDMHGGPNHAGNLCHAPVLVDAASGEVHFQPSFHYIAHFSKFVRPGARRLRLKGANHALQSIAFVNPDGSIAVVVVNPTDAAQEFVLAIGTDARSGQIPAHAIQTFLVDT